jgi:DNA-directed RNA polymerase subunit RPC12/RpoP
MALIKEEDLMVCRRCGGDLIEKTMLWYGTIQKRYKCIKCGLIY